MVGLRAGRRPPISSVLILEISLIVLLLALLFVPRWPSGFVHVLSVPSGARITTPEGLTFVAPASVPVPQEGTELALDLEGYAPADTFAECARCSVVVYMDYLFQISANSIPSGAEVFLDGTHVGITPLLTSTSEAGRHVLTVVGQDSVVLSDTIVTASHRRYCSDFYFPARASGGMVYVPGGEVELGGGPDGPPVRTVVSVDGFYLGRTEVTNLQFGMFLNSVDSTMDQDTFGREGMTALLSRFFPGNYTMEIVASKEGYLVREGLEQHPVRGVSWAGANAYCAWLTQVSGGRLSYRLPSEAEWQYAAMAGGSGPWPWGADPADGSLLNCSDANETIACRRPDLDDGYAESSPVGTYPPNAWGFSDMAGNVWEWCSDWAGGGGAATRSGTDSLRCLRGGSWLSSPEDCTCRARLGLSCLLGYPFAGFRVAADPGTEPGGLTGTPPR